MDISTCLACNGSGFEYFKEAEYVEITHFGSEAKQYLCVREPQYKLCDYCNGGYRGWTDEMLRPYPKNINKLGGFINEDI